MHSKAAPPENRPNIRAADGGGMRRRANASLKPSGPEMMVKPDDSSPRIPEG
jgi:hypothetical protein